MNPWRRLLFCFIAAAMGPVIIGAYPASAADDGGWRPAPPRTVANYLCPVPLAAEHQQQSVIYVPVTTVRLEDAGNGWWVEVAETTLVPRIVTSRMPIPEFTTITGQPATAAPALAATDAEKQTVQKPVVVEPFDDSVLEWNETALAAIQADGLPPPKAARVLAMLHIAIYDAVNAIDQTHEPFLVDRASSPGTSREAAVALAGYRVLAELFPGQRAKFATALSASLARIPNTPGKTAGATLGERVAGEVLALRANDGSNRVIPYTPGADPGQWRPTLPKFAPALLPGWGQVEPFAMKNGAQFRNADPPPLGSPRYERDLIEVQKVGAADSLKRTADQTHMAHFWADGAGTVTPPGHWNRIAQTLSRARGLRGGDGPEAKGVSLSENARLFALLNIALADAGISCWDSKYHCNFWRPITAIREADADGNRQTTADRDWQPLLDTPPFPSCTSGHSTFSAAAAVILAGFFGRDEIPFSDSVPGLDVPRSFTSFSQAAEEAGRSRIYGGIHFEFDNRAGQSSGKALGQFVFANFLKPLAPEVPAGVQAAKPASPLFQPPRTLTAATRPHVARYRPRVLVGGQPVNTLFIPNELIASDPRIDGPVLPALRGRAD